MTARNSFLAASFWITLLLLLPNKGHSAAYQGYTLVPSGTIMHLYDMNGTSLHTWKTSSSAATTAYLLEDGSVLVPMKSSTCSTRRDGAFPTGRFQKIAWDGTIVWDFQLCDGTYMPGYDLEPMPNGNVLIPADNTSSAGKIYEIQPSGTSGGTIVWTFTMPDSLNSQGTYLNSVSYNPDLDMVLCDLQTPVYKIVVIDHSVNPGKIVYTNKVASSGRLHAAKWVTKYYLGTKTLLPDADTIAMKINNMLVVNNSSQVVEINWTTKQATSIKYAFANNEGSVQRLPNGNTLVHKGMQQPAVVELDATGTSIGNLSVARSARAYRYGLQYPGVSRLSPSANLPKTAISGSVGNFFYSASTNIGKITVANSNGQSKHARIFSVSGAIVYSSSFHGSSTLLSTKNLVAGIYYLEVVHASGTYNARFVKTK